MAVINFPTKEERKSLDRKKSLEELTEIFDEPLKGEVKEHLARYMDLGHLPSRMAVTSSEGFTKGQLEAISDGFTAYKREAEERLVSLLEEIIDLRYQWATCKMLHGGEDPPNAI